MSGENIPVEDGGVTNIFTFLAMVLHSSGGQIEISSEAESAFEKWAAEGDFDSCSVLRFRNEESGAICLKLIDETNVNRESNFV